MTSIYHFFKFLVDNRHKLGDISNLEDLEFDHNFISSRNKGVFPDLAIKISADDLQGGEFVEIKDSKSYNIASFNSTIPTGKKDIQDIVNVNPSIKKQMSQAGNNIDSIPSRDVYYLIRGKKSNHTKIVLVHGSFFETIPVKDLISCAFADILKDVNLDDKDIERLAKLFSSQKLFSRVRHVKKAAIKIRFRVMSEVKIRANLLNANNYPEIIDDSLNLCIPYREIYERDIIINRFNSIFDDGFSIIDLTHKVDNSKFLLFQTKI